MITQNNFMWILFLGLGSSLASHDSDLEHQTMTKMSRKLFTDIPRHFPIFLHNYKKRALEILPTQISYSRSSVKLTPATSNDDTDANLSNDVEKYQSPDNSQQLIELEERFRMTNNEISLKDVFSVDIETHNTHLKDYHIISILGGSIMLAGFTFYVSLLLWKYYSRKKRGKRHILISEEENCILDENKFI